MKKLFATAGGGKGDFSPLCLKAGLDPKTLPSQKGWPKALKVLEDIEAAGTKRSVKEKLLADNAESKALHDVVRAAYHPYTKYFTYPGRAKPSPFTDKDEVDGRHLAQFLWVLGKLARREVTGNAARDLLDEAIAWGTPRERKWFRRIANRDFQCGIARTTCRKVWPDTIPQFEVPLAHSYSDFDLPFPAYAEYKYDGHRMFVIYDAETKTVMNLSRGGREKENVDHILDAVTKAAKHSPYPSFVMDGELFGRTFNDTGLASRKKTTANAAEAAKVLRFIVFDLVPLESFKAGIHKVSLRKRRKLLKAWLTKAKADPKVLLLSPLRVVKSAEELDEFYAEATAKGHEGAMVKNPKSHYICDRTEHWLKLKPVKDVTVTVKEVVEGTGKNDGRMGALVVEMDDGTETRVGGGWRDDCRGPGQTKCTPEHWDCRTCLWKHRKKIIGWKFDATTQAVGKSMNTEKLRHSRYAGRWRHDLM